MFVQAIGQASVEMAQNLASQETSEGDPPVDVCGFIKPACGD